MRFLFAAAALFTGIALTHADTVTLYTSIDQPIAAKVVKAFEDKSGHSVRLVTDTEATKSVGIAERLRAEKDKPRADVWWGNEPFYTIALASDGLLETLPESLGKEIDPQYVTPQWIGIGLRARVLAFSTQFAVKRAPGTPDTLSSIEVLANPMFKDTVVMARPTAGTTGGHVAALYVLWGDDKADAFFKKVHNNGVKLVGGNSVVAQQVAAGNFWLGVTDNDDVDAAIANGGHVRMWLPDQKDGEIGTLTIPTTLALVKKPDRSKAALALAEFLASPATEKMLIDEKFVAYSTRRDVGEHGVRAMKVDYAQVAKKLPDAIRRATAILEGR